MRIHFGVSKFIRPSTLIKILGSLFVGLLAYFGISQHQIVYAATHDVSPVTNGYFNSHTQTGTFYTTVTQYSSSTLGGNAYSIQVNQLNSAIDYFFLNYNSTGLCPNNQKIKYQFSTLINNTSNEKMGQALSISGVSGSSQIISQNASRIIWEITIPTNSGFKLIFYPSAPSGSNNNVADFLGISKTWDYSCVSSDSTNTDIINSNYQNTQDIIDNQNQNTQDIIDNQNQNTQDITDSLTDDDVSSATSDSSDLFGITLSDHGLTSVITAPLRFFSSLLDYNNSCTDLSFDISLGSLTKTVTLPSGCILWNNASNSIISIYHVIVFGLLGFYVLLDMYKFISSLLDPESKNLYIMDL